MNTVPGINRHDFEDCVSDVVLVALRTYNLKEHPNICGWLCVTSKNIARNFIRSRNKRSAFTSDTEIEDVISDYDFITDIENKEMYNDVLGRLSKSLSKSDFRLFQLKYIEKLPSKRISDILGITPVYVDVKCSRLRKKIEKTIKILK